MRGPIRGVPIRPDYEEHSVFGTILGAPIFGNFHVMATKTFVSQRAQRLQVDHSIYMDPKVLIW